MIVSGEVVGYIHSIMSYMLDLDHSSVVSGCDASLCTRQMLHCNA
jgi:hypothetical protein